LDIYFYLNIEEAENLAHTQKLVSLGQIKCCKTHLFYPFFSNNPSSCKDFSALWYIGYPLSL